MKTMLFSPAWKQSLVSIIRRFGVGGEVTSGKTPSLLVYRDESKLKNAMFTIRMALNPGEVFNAAVAARIKREAAAYQEFLRNPKKVGGIVLKVKEFVDSSSHTCVCREQYRIYGPLEGLTDPAEGRASVWYTFARSPNKVLEFVVHDENDKPLFPLVRTYTNWIADKQLNLGLNRTFYLTLAEGEAGYVNVRAGFTPVCVIEKVFDSVPQGRAAAACATVGTPVSSSESPFYSLEVRQPANALAFSIVALITLLSSVLLMQQMSIPKAKANVSTDTVQANNILPRTLEVGAPAASQLKVTGDNAGSSSAADLQTGPPQKSETLLRLADIRGFKVSVDKKSSCQGRCLKLLNGIEDRLKSRLDGLNLPPAAPEAVAVNKPSASVVVSYLPLDAERGKIHISLSDHEGSLWNVDHEFDHLLSDDVEISDAQITDLYSEQFSTEVLLTVFRAKDHCLSEADRGSTSQEQTK